jgi:pilus assembly protein Flp/PilA
LPSQETCDVLYHQLHQILALSPHHRGMNMIRKFLVDESGATAIEYALLAAGIALAIVSAVQGIGPQLNTKFTSINSSLK